MGKETPPIAETKPATQWPTNMSKQFHTMSWQTEEVIYFQMPSPFEPVSLSVRYQGVVTCF